MWLVLAMMGTATAAEGPQPVEEGLKPDGIAIGIGGRIRTSADLSAVARVRLPSAVSVEVSLGAGGRRTGSTELFMGNTIKETTGSRSGLAAIQLRVPAVRANRQDILLTLGVEGQLSRSLSVATVENTPIPGLQTTTRNSRSGSAYVGMDIDHWVTPGCAITLTAQAASLQTTRGTSTTDAGEPVPSSSWGLGISPSIGLGVTGYR